MGEWSKKIGEYGEDTVEKFLSIIGWNAPAKGIVIPCSMLNEEHKNEKEKIVQTHGIDFLYSYINPFIDGQLNNIIISSKYSSSLMLLSFPISLFLIVSSSSLYVSIIYYLLHLLQSLQNNR